MNTVSTTRRVIALAAAVVALAIPTVAHAAVPANPFNGAGTTLTTKAVATTPPTPPTPSAPAAPSNADADEERSTLAPGARGDLFVGLGLKSKCNALTGDARINCERSGSAATEYPTSNYGFDINVSGVKKPIANALHNFAQMFWLLLLYLFKGVVILLDTAMGINPLDPASAEQMKKSLGVGGLSISLGWWSLGLAVLASWMVWRGLVQRKVGQAFAGVGLSVVMMIFAAAVILDPAGTAGKVAQGSNAASTEMFAVFTGDPGGGQAAVGNRQKALFDMVAVPAWCALEFGNVEFCREGDVPKGTPGAKKAETPKDVFLQYPLGADEREKAYNAWRDADGSIQQEAVQIQRAGGVGTRYATLALIVFAMLGAIIFFGALTIRLVAYAVMFLVLLLFAPFMFIVACFGDAGRQAFLGWGRRLLGALVGKVIFSAVLAVTILASNAFSLIFAQSFLLTWFLLGVLWWTMIVKHDDFAEWLSAGAMKANDHGGMVRALATAYYGGKMLGNFSRAALRPGQAMQQRLNRVSLSTQEAARDNATGARRDQARHSLETQLASDRQVVQEAEGWRQEQQELRQRLRGDTDGYTRHTTQARLQELDQRLQSPELARASANHRHAASNEAAYGISVTTDDADKYLEGMETMSRRAPSPPSRLRQLISRNQPAPQGPHGERVEPDAPRLVITGDSQPVWHEAHDGVHQVPTDRDLRAVGTTREQHLRSDQVAQEAHRQSAVEAGEWHARIAAAAPTNNQDAPTRMRAAYETANTPGSAGTARERLARGVAEMGRQEVAGARRASRLTDRIRRSERHRDARIKTPPRIDV